MRDFVLRVWLPLPAVFLIWVPCACEQSGENATDVLDTCTECEIHEPTCGDGLCEGDETQATCCSDCGCSGEYLCANNHCELEYVFDGLNMFFGLNFVTQSHLDEIADLGLSRFSIQYRATWYTIEAQRGDYNWTSIDAEVNRHQGYGADSMVCFTGLWNAWGEDRVRVEETLDQIQRDTGFDRAAAWIYLNRDLQGGEEFMPDPENPEDDNLVALLQFTSALVERYDGDGIDDMPGLKYPIRYWHLINEWPGPGHTAEFTAKIYAAMYPIIKDADPHALVVLPGLYSGPHGRIFAYADGFIDDDEASVRDGEKHADRDTVLDDTSMRWFKTGYEAIVELAYDYYDVVDIHLYLEKETFIEGLIDYLRAHTDKPIIISEGKHGPFKLPDPEEFPECDNDQGEDHPWESGRYFSPAEHAEFVVKTNVLLASKGLERRHFGIKSSGCSGYWKGPWGVLGLLHDETPTPAYHTFKQLIAHMWDFDEVTDVGEGDLRVFRIDVAGADVYVAWNLRGEREVYEPTDLSGLIPYGDGDALVTFIITMVGESGQAIEHRPADTFPLSQIPVGLTPVLVKDH